MTKNKNWLVILLLGAFIVKLIFFILAELYSPQAKFQNDSAMYMDSGSVLASQGKFARYDGAGKLQPEIYRTPGYPLFLALFHFLLRIPLTGIMLIQIALSVLAAFIVYKTALLINPRLCFLSTFIIAYDPPISIFSMMILTDMLFLFFMTVAMYFFVVYMRNRRLPALVMVALMSVVATYVRPICYYLGAALSFFVVYLAFRYRVWRMVRHALIFFLIVFSALGIWQYRNYRLTHLNIFCFRSIVNITSHIKQFSINDEPCAQQMGPVLNAANVFGRGLMRFMTTPGSFKYYDLAVIKIVGKLFAFPFMAFWFLGFLVALFKIKNDLSLQFLLFVVFYYIFVSVGNIPWEVGVRFRVPAMPCIAILSAHGWEYLRAAILIPRLQYKGAIVK